jgi:hypothetical protein
VAGVVMSLLVRDCVDHLGNVDVAQLPNRSLRLWFEAAIGGYRKRPQYE